MYDLGENAAHAIIQWLRDHKWTVPVFVYISCDPLEVISLESRYGSLLLDSSVINDVDLQTSCVGNS